MEDLYFSSRTIPQKAGASKKRRRFDVRSQGAEDVVGEIDVEILEGDVVITVRRVDEAYFGPVSLVVR